MLSSMFSTITSKLIIIMRFIKILLFLFSRDATTFITRMNLKTLNWIEAFTSMMYRIILITTYEILVIRVDNCHNHISIKSGTLIYWIPALNYVSNI